MYDWSNAPVRRVDEADEVAKQLGAVPEHEPQSQHPEDACGQRDKERGLRGAVETGDDQAFFLPTFSGDANVARGPSAMAAAFSSHFALMQADENGSRCQGNSPDFHPFCNSFSSPLNLPCMAYIIVSVVFQHHSPCHLALLVVSIQCSSSGEYRWR